MARRFEILLLTTTLVACSDDDMGDESEGSSTADTIVEIHGTSGRRRRGPC
jgi:hypothetical protein